MVKLLWSVYYALLWVVWFWFVGFHGIFAIAASVLETATDMLEIELDNVKVEING